MISPLNSSAAFFRRSLDDLSSLRGEAERLQRAIGTGERIERGSDDPLAAARLRALDRAQALGEVDEANAFRAAEELALGGDTLATITDELFRARDLTIQAASESLNDSQRALIAEELDTIRQSLLAAANTVSIGDTPLFGGEVSGPAYVTDAGGAVRYVGTVQPGEIDVGQGISIERGVTGPDAFGFPANGTQTDVFAFLAALSASLRDIAGDPAGAARAALGGFDNALDSVNRAQTVIGVRAAWIDTVQQTQVNLDEARSRERAETGGADITETIAKLQQTLTVLEASQAGFVRLSNLSLFDAI